MIRKITSHKIPFELNVRLSFIEKLWKTQTQLISDRDTLLAILFN